MNEYDHLYRQAQRYKELYPKGTRILLLHMGDDPRPIEDDMRGTVMFVDDMSTVHCKFDNGRQLGIIPGEDTFRKLTDEELAEEQTDSEDMDEEAAENGFVGECEGGNSSDEETDTETEDEDESEGFGMTM